MFSKGRGNRKIKNKKAKCFDKDVVQCVQACDSKVSHQ